MRFTSLVLFTFLGCSSNSGSNNPPDLPEFEVCADVACTLAATATTPAELETAILQGATWTPHGEYTGGCLPASGDIAVTGGVTVTGADISPPSPCTGEGCNVRFRIRGTVAGVVCLDPEHLFDFTMCGAIEVTDATIRVRTVREDLHPAFPSSVPLVEVLPACDQPCGAGEFRCEATSTCWSSERDYCAYCLGGDNEVCACWTGGEFQADGSECSMYVTGDIIVDGTCNAGICEEN